MGEKTVAVICEYNPFHNGHLYQLNKIRENGADCIIGVMSGSFTQRGEPAIIPKYERALCAVKSGMDIVVELPFPFCSSYAEAFAAAGVRIAASMGADELNFGSESADIDTLSELAKISLSDVFNERIRSLNEYGSTTYLKELERAHGNFTFSSNDILGFQYVREIARQGLSMIPTCTKRIGSSYNSLEITGNRNSPASASAIRAAIDNGSEIQGLVPGTVIEVMQKCMSSGIAPADIKNAERAILMHFRLTDPSNHRDIADIPVGFSERLHIASKQSGSLSEMISMLTGTSFSESRIRRCILFCICGVRRSDLDHRNINKVDLLALNETGRKYLSSKRKTVGSFVRTKPSANAESDQKCRLMADALYSLMTPSIQDTGMFLRHSPYIV